MSVGYFISVGLRLLLTLACWLVEGAELPPPMVLVRLPFRLSAFLGILVAACNVGKVLHSSCK